MAIVSHGKPELPRVTIPEYSRIAERLTLAVEQEWQLQSTVVDYFTHESIPTAVLEARRCDDALSDGLVSIDPDTFSENDLTPDERAKLKAILSGELNEHGPFAHIGSMDEVEAWIQSKAQSHNWKLTGRFRQFNASASFSLIRFETTGPALWFKAVGPPNTREFPITVTLAQLFPAFVPSIIATHELWNAWLTIEADGSHLDERSEIALWERAVTSLADLQIRSAERTEELIDAGCRDLRIPALIGCVDPFLEVVEALMKKQPKVPPPILEKQELVVLAAEIENACTRLRGLGFPDTLVHLDFNPGNILVSSTSCVFLDWAEACVSSPFLTLQYLFEHYRRSNSENSVGLSELVSSYTEIWRSVAASEQIAEAFEVAPLLAVFAYAVGNDAWRDAKRLEDPRLAGYFRALARRMQREAIALQRRRELCLA